MVYVWIHRVLGDLIVHFGKLEDAYEWTVNTYAEKYAPDEFSNIPSFESLKAAILAGDSLPIVFCTYCLQVSIVHSGFVPVTDEVWLSSNKITVTKEEAMFLGEYNNFVK